MDSQEQWIPVRSAKATVVDVSSGRATIRWSLEGDVTEQWAACFLPQGTRKGSGAYVLSGGEPVIQPDLSITWTIPEADAEDANAYVKQSVEATNNRFKQIKEDQRRRSEFQDSIRESERTNAAEIQRRLDDLNQ